MTNLRIVLAAVGDSLVTRGSVSVLIPSARGSRWGAR